MPLVSQLVDFFRRERANGARRSRHGAYFIQKGQVNRKGSSDRTNSTTNGLMGDGGSLTRDRNAEGAPFATKSAAQSAEQRPKFRPRDPHIPHRTTAVDPKYLVGGLSINRARHVNKQLGTKHTQTWRCCNTYSDVGSKYFPKKSMFRHLLDQAHMLVKGICL